MMKRKDNSGVFSRLKGDKTIWAIVALLAIFSFLPVYSASSNLAYLGTENGSTFTYLVKHFFHLAFGLLIMFGIHKIPYRYYRNFRQLFYVCYILVSFLNGSTGVSS